jgi:uracil-DNA glycosylase
MSMSREDVLRELELLPVWKLRNPVTAQELEADIVETVEEVAPSIVLESQIATVETHAESVVNKPIVQKIIKQWALILPISHVQDHECTLLINNMIKAMRLTSEDYVLIHETQALANYEVGDILLFGLDTANQHLNLNALSLDDLRGKSHLVEDVRCWVTYHPEQMLLNPLLKRYVWQDICAAMPHLTK